MRINDFREIFAFYHVITFKVYLSLYVYMISMRTASPFILQISFFELVILFHFSIDLSTHSSHV